MGADIHMYVEYVNKESKKRREENGEPPYWMSFGRRINPGRNYIMFGLLAGVRYDSDKSLEPKGLPTDLGYTSMRDSRLFITEDGEGDGETTMENAIRWNENYKCKLYNGSNGEPTWVDHPDWHSHSWLTTKEFAKVLKTYKELKENWGTPIEYDALLAAMKTLEKGGHHEARIVFWFDN